MEAAKDIVAGNLVVRPGEALARVAGRPVPLTVRELALLVELARRSGRVVPRAELYTAVWHQPFRRCERSVDVYVARLRHKLEGAAPDWAYIHTHFGLGYRFDARPLD